MGTLKMATTKYILFNLVVAVLICHARVIKNKPELINSDQSPDMDFRLMKKAYGGYLNSDRLNRMVMDTLANTNPSYYFTPVKKSFLLPFLQQSKLRAEDLIKKNLQSENLRGRNFIKRAVGVANAPTFNDMALNLDAYLDGF